MNMSATTGSHENQVAFALNIQKLIYIKVAQRLTLRGGCSSFCPLVLLLPRDIPPPGSIFVQPYSSATQAKSIRVINLFLSFHTGHLKNNEREAERRLELFDKPHRRFKNTKAQAYPSIPWATPVFLH